jgi:hypothetical protein
VAYGLPRPYTTTSTPQGIYFLQDVSLPTLPPTVRVGATDYHRVNHLHCTLIKLDQIIREIAQNQHLSLGKATIVATNAVVAAIISLKPHVGSYQTRFRVAAKPEQGRQTIVVLADLERNHELQQSVSLATGTAIPPRPAHVTLYTLANGQPIGLANQTELEVLSRPLTSVEFSELAGQVDLKGTLGVKV